ncbi:MAG: DUF1214 domain-containing protein [Microvirga sp.]
MWSFRAGWRPASAAPFWNVTAYNITDGTMVETPQFMPSINGFNEVATNGDGSVDLWFGSSKSAEASDLNFIQTVSGRSFSSHRACPVRATRRPGA